MHALVIFVLALTTSTALGAQVVVETPIAFDSAQRVLAVTPTVAERFHLSAPAWPVRGDYREARLFAVEPGGSFVLVVQRPTGALERLSFTAAERAALQSAIDAGMSAVGRPSVDVAADVVSEPAGSAFARHQTVLGAAIYGPLAASLADEGSGSGALYLLVTGASFFVSYSAAQSNPFTRAQSDLAGNLGIAVGGGGGLLAYAATGNSDKGVRAVALGSAIVGTVLGVELGRTLSDAEAHAATLGITAAAATALTVTNMAGASSRASATAVALVGAVGYPIGVRYPRHASYTVTAGDVDATSTAGLVGVLVGAAAVGGIDNPSDKQVAAYLGSGYLGGLLMGDLLIARPLELTRSQATIVNIGAFAGALLGVAIPVVAKSDNVPFIFGAAATGAALGMGALAASFPPRGGAAERTGTLPQQKGENSSRLSFQPTSLAAALGGVRGNHVLARLSF
jgi:hypothetical protein